MLKQPTPVVIDFETSGIASRPAYPPAPCGVSIKYPNRAARYYPFGHLSPNMARGVQVTQTAVRRELRRAYDHPDGMLFQNGKFDLDVAEVHLGLPLPQWDRVHDTLFLLFLDDPHQAELSLKPSAERLLGLPPGERDELVEWLVQHQPVPGVKISASKASESYAMKYVPYAPPSIVGKYANGDVDRTEGLFNLLWPKTQSRGMLGAYDRERQLMPILLEMERRGVAVANHRLQVDVELYQDYFAQVDRAIYRMLKCNAFNLNSGDELMRALIGAKKVDLSKVPRTKSGKKLQTNKDVLLQAISDQVLLASLGYRSQLKTFLGTFMEPWAKTALASGGVIYTLWNQVRSADSGTRTGRLSSTPNFQNIPKEAKPHFAHRGVPAKIAKTLPAPPVRGLPDLPSIRAYITPFKGQWLIDRDYSQQEPRILAHFDGGALMQKYLDDPWIDFHDYARIELAKMGLIYERKPVKNTNLGLIYGMGVGKLAMKNDMNVKEASTLRKSILHLYPGLREMYRDMQQRARNHEPIRTWGGREYYCEEPRIVDGRIREFDYKMVNVLIQGSAADCTKEAIIRFHTAASRERWPLILNVHDQLTASVPPRERVKAMGVLQHAMESVEFDVPILTEGSMSNTNWAELVDFDKRGRRL